MPNYKLKKLMLLYLFAPKIKGVFTPCLKFMRKLLLFSVKWGSKSRKVRISKINFITLMP